MPIITAGLYKITLKQTVNFKVIFNTYFYEETLGRDDEQDLCADAFDSDVIPFLDNIQSTALTYDEIAVDNVTGSLAAVSIDPTIAAGAVVGDLMPSFVAAGFKLVRTTKETRNGSKRIAGMVEQNVVGNGWTAGFLADLQTASAVFNDQISAVGALFNPVIARQDPITPTNWVVNPIAAAIVNVIPTSQVSRKVRA